MEDCYNRVELCGQILTAPELSHTNHGELFYRFILSVPRLSGQSDDLPVLVRQNLLPDCLQEGDTVTLTGQLRSFNNRSGQGRRLILSIFARCSAGGESPLWTLGLLAGDHLGAFGPAGGGAGNRRQLLCRGTCPEPGVLKSGRWYSPATHCLRGIRYAYGLPGGFPGGMKDTQEVLSCVSFSADIQIQGYTWIRCLHPECPSPPAGQTVRSGEAFCQNTSGFHSRKS